MGIRRRVVVRVRGIRGRARVMGIGSMGIVVGIIIASIRGVRRTRMMWTTINPKLPLLLLLICLPSLI